MIDIPYDISYDIYDMAYHMICHIMYHMIYGNIIRHMICTSGTLVQSLVHAVLIFCKIIKIAMPFDQWLRRRWGGQLISPQICMPAGSRVHQVVGFGLGPWGVRA
jgi:hypothetical protein